MACELPGAGDLVLDNYVPTTVPDTERTHILVHRALFTHVNVAGAVAPPLLVHGTGFPMNQQVARRVDP